MKPATTHRATKPVNATLSALENPDGAIPNAKLKERARRSRHAAAPKSFGKIVVVQPAARHWLCDGCPEKGFGGVKLLEHSGASGHRVFTPLD